MHDKENKRKDETSIKIYKNLTSSSIFLSKISRSFIVSDKLSLFFTANRILLDYLNGLKEYK
jgi:hypothetical protein